METYSFITNNCLGDVIYKHLNIKFDNPFIGSYFQDDDQFLKFCLNFKYYTSLVPVFKKGLLPIDTNCPSIPPDSFPIMFLDDIEIHWIHETSREELLQKYNRRLSRMKTPFFVWGDSMLHRLHTDNKRQDIISTFSNIENSVYFKKEDVDEWKDKSFNDRKENNGWAQPLNWLDFNFAKDLLVKYFGFKKIKEDVKELEIIENLSLSESITDNIDVIIPIYYNYYLAQQQMERFRHINGNWTILFCDNTPPYDQIQIVVPNDLINKVKIFKYESFGIDGEKHGSVLDHMVKQSTSKIICIMDSDFFWTNNNILTIAKNYFSKGYKCVGTELHYTGFDYVNVLYPNRAGNLAPCIFGMFIDRELALSETFISTRHEGYTDKKETGWRIREKIINNKIPCIVFPAIQLPEQKNINYGHGGCWFYIVDREVSGFHILQGSGVKANETVNLLPKLLKMAGV